MKKKKNRFLLFWCSLIPGAGEMYLGFMKTGISLLSGFALGIMIASYTSVGILAIIPMVIWIYGFFHANNLGALSDEEFYQVQDVYLFGLNEDEAGKFKVSLTGKYKKWLAAALIFIGMSMLWQVVCDVLYDILGHDLYRMYFAKIARVVGNTAPRLVVGVLIIWLGIRLIQGKKEELDRLEEKDADMEQKAEGNVVFPIEQRAEGNAEFPIEQKEEGDE